MKSVESQVNTEYWFRVEYFSLHGLTVALRGNSAGLQKHLRSLFFYFGMKSLAGPGDGPVVSLDVEVCASLPEIPAGARQATRHGAIALYADGDGYWVRDSKSLFRIFPGRGQGHGWLHRPAWQNLEALTPSHIDIIVFVLLCMLQHHEMFALHAACVVQGDTACLIVGESGSGKSTLALGFLEEGWGYLSDDSVLLQPEKNGAVAALSVRQRLYLYSETLGRVHRMGAVAENGNSSPRVKQFLDAAICYPGQIRPRCRPTVIIFPQIVDRPESELVPAGAGSRIYYELLRHSALIGANRRKAGRHLALLKTLLSQTRQFDLKAGWDLKERPGRITHLLAGVAEPLVKSEQAMSDRRAFSDEEVNLLRSEQGRPCVTRD